jgi:hypothetical protein
MKRSTIATVLALTVFASPIWGHAAKAEDPHHPDSGTTVQPAMPPSQPGMGRMPMMNMMGGMAMIDHVEGRIAFLRTELKITEVQTSAWNAFADALRANAQKLGEIRASMMPQPGAAQQQVPTLVDRLDLQERWHLARLEGTRTLKSAFTKLYETLSDDQKKTANELLAPHMGMGMMAMMPGQMQPTQMRPSAR